MRNESGEGMARSSTEKEEPRKGPNKGGSDPDPVSSLIQFSRTDLVILANISTGRPGEVA